MAFVPRPRKRVFAILRAPDGSAFQKCEICGVSVAVALADMHHCDTKMGSKSKRFKGMQGMRSVPKSNDQRFKNQPASPFRLFMESFMKSCKIKNFLEADRAGVERWQKMSHEDKQPYVCHARVLDYNHQEALNKEANEIIKVDDEADSAMVGKFDKYGWFYLDSSDDTESSSS
ncbi:high mobility group B protein 7 [Abrus precatorius]|uniref:High mobility group B protein 7 n=1 Tax=Abrus precatorius TaxID=3816 RepID=A0A8B8MLP2_ABRPR|nr:high mobility group B protein 7 [Abrus precatorius]